MLEGDLPEVANKYRCLELFKERVSSFVSSLPIPEGDRPKLKFSYQNNNSGRALLGITIEAPCIDKIREFGLFQLLKNTAFELNADMGLFGFAKSRRDKYIVHCIVEFFALPSADKNKADVFKEQFYDYLTNLSIEYTLPINLNYSQAIVYPCNFPNGYVVKGTINIDSDFDACEGIGTIPSYDNEIRKIISELRNLSTRAGGKFSTAYAGKEGQTIFEFTVLFESSSFQILYN